jgi:hypothetical protein
LADFIFATACNHPRVKDPKALLQIIDRYHFAWDTEVSVETDPTTNQEVLSIFGYGWPGAWKVPDGLDQEDCELDYEGEGIEGFEQFLTEMAPYLADPLTVQSVGSVQCRFPLSACEWHVQPNAEEVEVNAFRHCDQESDQETPKPTLNQLQEVDEAIV